MNVTPLVTADLWRGDFLPGHHRHQAGAGTEHRANVQLKTLAIQQLVFQEEERRTPVAGTARPRQPGSGGAPDGAGKLLAAGGGPAKAQVALRDANAIANSILETTATFPAACGRRCSTTWGWPPPCAGTSTSCPGPTWSASASRKTSAPPFPRRSRTGLLPHRQGGALQRPPPRPGRRNHRQVQYGDEGPPPVDRDDGRGFDADQAAEDSRKLNSLGLLGMRGGGRRRRRTARFAPSPAGHRNLRRFPPSSTVYRRTPSTSSSPTTITWSAPAFSASSAKSPISSSSPTPATATKPSAWPRKNPDVALPDIAMPGTTGLQALEHLHRTRPQIKIIVLTMYDTEEHVISAMRLGAAGFMLKNAAPQEMELAIRAVTAGGRLPAAISRPVVDAYLERVQISDQRDGLTPARWRCSR